MLDIESDYQQWRQLKLDGWAVGKQIEPVLIADPNSLSQAELEQLQKYCEKTNFVIYRLLQPELASKRSIRNLGTQLGMQGLDKNLCADEDSVSSLQVMDFGKHSIKGYIPYTSNKLNWHTDGYYNELHQHIRSFLLHCINKAASGGDNFLLNHELVYIRLYDEDPQLVAALMQNDVMTIPANSVDPQNLRPTQTGPVFYRDQHTNNLQMRYTARTRNIIWKNDPMVGQAISMIEELLADQRDLIEFSLNPGEGLICNNILHGRSAFTNGNIPEQQRLIYRIRSYNRLFS
ncbi:MAG: TauD/TfdA family dioxygenase [Pseudomonadota bacterium]